MEALSAGEEMHISAMQLFSKDFNEILLLSQDRHISEFPAMRKITVSLVQYEHIFDESSLTRQS